MLKNMGVVDFKKDKSNWVLRPTLGLGNISLGDNVLDFFDVLSLKCKGDLDTQCRNIFLDMYGEIKRPNPNLVGGDFLYESSELDLEFYSDDNISISNIITGQYCIFDGVELIGAEISKITSIWGLPSTMQPDAFGLDFSYDEIGLNVKFDEHRRVSWINISAPYED